MPKGTTALAGWLGGNRMLASHVGVALQGCTWVGVPFAGGMSELPHITARTMLVNDKHRHVINLARVVADDKLRPELIRRLRRKAPCHPDELKSAQVACKTWEYQIEEGRTELLPSLAAAEAYFVSCWMGRASKAGTKDEFNGRPATRWNAGGGDSAVRYFSAIRMLATFSRTLRRCTFETLDAFEFLAKCKDTPKTGIYADPPFPEKGRAYLHNAGQTDAEERVWHARLRDRLVRFERTRIVARFYEHPLIRELYAEPDWPWQTLVGRTQSNDDAPELLLVRNGRVPELFV